MYTAEFEISSEEYQQIARLVYDRFGINLGDKKQSLVSNRLRKELSDRGFNSFKDFYQYCLDDKSGTGLNTLINRISTNLTYFAREREHFDFLRDYAVPGWLGTASVQQQKSIRVWCAGCSTGEEAYTIAMMLQSGLGMKSGSIKPAVLATDISERALAVAEKGIYLKDNVAKLDPDWVGSFFKKQSDGSFRVSERIRQIVLYRRLNLMRPHFPFKKRFHAIFCRNVMIYFDGETRGKLISKFSENLEEGGYLFIGHSESLGRSNQYFKYIRPAVYQKVAV